MLCADKVDTEVGMEVSVQQEFSPELKDNNSKAYKDFSDNFKRQVRGKRRGLKGSHLELIWTPGDLRSGGSDVSPGILCISDAEGLPKCAGVQGCGDLVLEVGDSSGTVEVVLGGGRECEERIEKPSLGLESSDFIKRGMKSVQGNRSMGDFEIIFWDNFL